MGRSTALDRISSTVLTPPRQGRDQLASELIDALAGTGSLSPAHLYDARGSELFEAITATDEYYLTRTEAAVLAAQADAIIAAARPAELVELGSGSSSKTGVLLTAMQAAGTGDRYAALDVSAAALDAAAERLAVDHDGLAIDNYVGDFHTDLERIPRTGPRLLLFLGSTLGNMHPDDRRTLLSEVTASMHPGDTFLVGVDLVKDLDVLLPAYDDAAGVSAAFALNLLTIIDRELAADLPPDAFRYEAVWDEAETCVEMRLVARHDLTATIGALADRQVHIAAGDRLVTERSYKFRIPELHTELASIGLATRAVHTDARGYFAVVLAELATS